MGAEQMGAEQMGAELHHRWRANCRDLQCSLNSWDLVRWLNAVWDPLDERAQRGNMNKELSRYRVTFTFEARDEREVAMLMAQPDLLRAEAEMRVENVSRRWDLRMAALASPLVIALFSIGWGLAKVFWRQ